MYTVSAAVSRRLRDRKHADDCRAVVASSMLTNDLSRANICAEIMCTARHAPVRDGGFPHERPGSNSSVYVRIRTAEQLCYYKYVSFFSCCCMPEL